MHDTEVKLSQGSSSQNPSMRKEGEQIRPSDLYVLGCKTLMVVGQVEAQTIKITTHDGIETEIVIRSPASLMIGVFPLDVSLSPGVHPIPPRMVTH